jgi:FSR family fosmidomycin resistance protein-like MFS transporter
MQFVVLFSKILMQNFTSSVRQRLFGYTLHGSEIYASSLLAVYLATSAFGMLLGGAMSDHYGSKRVMMYSIFPISVLLYLFPVVGNIGAFIVLSLVSILLSATFTSSLVLAQRMMPNNVGMVSGLTIGLVLV